LSLRALAERSGITASLLSGAETGKSEGRFSVIPKLAAVFKVDMDDLIPVTELGARSACPTADRRADSDYRQRDSRPFEARQLIVRLACASG
jgi:transcriptional regulator with XRE-family HTH domain